MPRQHPPSDISLHRPSDREQSLGFGSLGQPLLELVNELIAFLHDLVLNLEDLLSPAAFELLDLLLNLVLFFQRHHLPG